MKKKMWMKIVFAFVLLLSVVGVNVNDVEAANLSVKISKSSVTVITGKTITFSATVPQSPNKNNSISWKSSNTKIATVDSKGKVTGKAKGTATITASAKSAKSATAKVTVAAPVTAKSVKLNKTSATITKGKTVTLSATVSPSNTTNKTLKWKSSNTKVAKVDSIGKVTAVGTGTAKITVTTSNSKSTTASITVSYSKILSAGNWKGGSNLPAGRYRITTTSEFGSVNIITPSFERDIYEILTNDDDYGVTKITTDIKSGDKIEISGLDKVLFTKVSNVKSNTLHTGYWTVGKDINAGRYRITTPNDLGGLFISRGDDMVAYGMLMHKPKDGGVGSITTTLKNGDRIEITGLDKVIFTKSK